MVQISNFNSNNSRYMSGMQVQTAPAIERNHDRRAKWTAALRNAGGAAAGAVVGLAPIPYVISDSISKSSQDDLKMLKKVMTSILPNIDTLENTQKNIVEILKETGLKEKGVELIIASEKNKSEVSDLMEQSIKGKSKFKKLMRESFLQKLREGINACYLPNTRKIIVPQNQLYMSAYHEAGHAYDFLKSGLGKILAKGRYLTPFCIPVFAPLFLGVGLLHNKKNIPENEKLKFEKTKDFIKDNAGKLTLLNCVPFLAEEGLASVNGLRFAKKYLKPQQWERLGAGYALTWLTYASVALMFTFGVWSGIKLKDKIAGAKKDRSSVSA